MLRSGTFGLLARHGEDRKPAWARLSALVEARWRAAGLAFPRRTPLD